MTVGKKCFPQMNSLKFRVDNADKYVILNGKKRRYHAKGK